MKIAVKNPGVAVRRLANILSVDKGNTDEILKEAEKVAYKADTNIKSGYWIHPSFSFVSRKIRSLFFRFPEKVAYKADTTVLMNAKVVFLSDKKEKIAIPHGNLKKCVEFIDNKELTSPFWQFWLSPECIAKQLLSFKCVHEQCSKISKSLL